MWAHDTLESHMVRPKLSANLQSQGSHTFSAAELPIVEPTSFSAFNRTINSYAEGCRLSLGFVALIWIILSRNPESDQGYTALLVHIYPAHVSTTFWASSAWDKPRWAILFHKPTEFSTPYCWKSEGYSVTWQACWILSVHPRRGTDVV